jgi:hypothetical protein
MQEKTYKKDCEPLPSFLLQKAFNKFINSERVPVVLDTGEKDRQRELANSGQESDMRS